MREENAAAMIIRVFAKKHGFDMIEVFKDRKIPVKLLSDIQINEETVHNFEILIDERELDRAVNVLQFYEAYDYIVEMQVR